MSKTSRSGFTLIELLLILIIGGLLCVILLPRPGDFRRADDYRVIRQNLETIQKQLAADFARDHRYPLSGDALLVKPAVKKILASSEVLTDITVYTPEPASGPSAGTNGYTLKLISVPEPEASCFLEVNSQKPTEPISCYLTEPGKPTLRLQTLGFVIGS